MRCVACGTSEERGGSAFCRVCGGSFEPSGPRVTEVAEVGRSGRAAPTVVEPGPSRAVARVLEARLEPELGARLALDVARAAGAASLLLAATHLLVLLRSPLAGLLGAVLPGVIPGHAVREGVAFVILAAVASGALTYAIFRLTSRRWRNVR